MQEHIRDVRESLPRGYYRELPALDGGALTGYPRVFELAVTLISHTEGRIDVDNVNLFLGAFQAVAPLTIGELWAVPAMLRLGLLENIRRMALRTVKHLEEVEEADRWAHQVHVASERGEAALDEAIAPYVRDAGRLTPVFVSRFLHQVRLAAGATPSLSRLERWIADEGLSAEDATSRSNQRLAITQLVMANSITSLRAVGALNWRQLVEGHSALDAVLRQDPSGFYERMTFATRDSYRHVVERIAKRTGRTEEDVARAALALTTPNQGDPCEAHVGYYLVDDGLPQLERAMSYRPELGVRLRRFVLRHPNFLLWGGVLTGTGLGLALLLAAVGPASPLMCLAIALLAWLPVSDVAVTAMNQLVTIFLPPLLLPKLNVRGPQGVPAELRTAVVIPTLLGNVEAVHAALQNLEVQYLANREANLYFALLTDFTDASTEHREGDAEIVAAAVAGLNALNERYANDNAGSFFLFHRPRRLSPTQHCWMGWERKRGKLAEFNAYLRGGAREAFSVVVGDVAQLPAVRYVITLDADTVLPPDAAPLLIGTLAHPLNRAVYNPRRGRVMRGYGILQPRVVVSLPSAHASRFAAIHSGHPGVDPYTTAVSDVYQDLYGEGSYTGKGIYDVDVFEEATRGRFPEGTVLSHDLIEGSHARAGLVTDVNVYDDYPAHYLTFSRRKHRWIRGDWQ
ncbi:MAG TPA: cyclic beta 1-2 glucan synthetase, partial [Polyangia bacterium]